LRHGGSHASDTASSKRRRRRRGHLTERVQRRVRLFVHLRRRGPRVGGGRVALPDGESRRWSAYVWAGEAGALIFIIAACGLI
jgi:hypothetical protein